MENLTQTMDRESLTSTETEAREKQIAQIDSDIEQEVSMLDKMLLVAKLRRLGYKIGNCDYCKAKTENKENGEIGLLVYVRRLPNRLKACFLCYDRSQFGGN